MGLLTAWGKLDSPTLPTATPEAGDKHASTCLGEILFLPNVLYPDQLPLMCQGRTQAFLYMKVKGTSYPSPFLKYLLEEDSIIHGSRKYAFKLLCFRRGWRHLESLCKMKVVIKCSFHGGAHSGWVYRPGFGRKPRRKCSRYPASEPMPWEGEEVLQGHHGVYESWAHICVIKTERQT